MKSTKPKTLKTSVSIKAQLVIGFLIPIIFVIIVGISGYSRAADGMRENYENSARTAMEMSVSCLDQAFKPIATNILTLSSDTNISGLIKGFYDKNTSNRSFYSSSASETFYVVEGTDDYAVYCSIMSGSKTNPGVLIIDISKQAIIDLMKQMDFGENSSVFFITPENLIIQTGTSSIDLLNTDFYQSLTSSEAATTNDNGLVAEYVKYNNEDYYFLTEAISSFHIN